MSTPTTILSAPCRLHRTDGSVVPIAGNLTIGRGSSNGLTLTTEKASRRHASIHAQNGGEFWLIDLGSVNGTFLNGRRVFQPIRLQSGDTIELAGERFIFRQEQSITDESEALGIATVPTIPRIASEPCWLMVAD